MTVVTLAERKAAGAAGKAAAVEALRPRLTASARALGGRFLLYGSAARGTMRWDSDVDLLLDFPDDDAASRAWNAAEAVCRDLGLVGDIRPVGLCGTAFLEHVLPRAVVLG